MTLFAKRLKKSKKGLAVIFDGVERTDMDAPELLGYINEYVEHLGVSCILLADKERWDEANSMRVERPTLHRLASTQEKVIGKIFNIQTTIDDILAVWLKDDKFLDPRLLKILQENETVIKEVIRRSGVNNFRSLKHALLELERFLRITSIWKYLDNQEFAELFLREFIALCYSIYLGELKASDIGVSNYLAQIQDKTKEDSPYDNFKKKYRGFDFISECSIDYKESWIKIFKTCFGENVIPVDVVNNVVQDEIWFEGHDKYWMSKVGDFFMCDEDADGIEALNTFYSSMDNGKILDATDLYLIYYKLVYFADIDALKENKAEFQELILDYAKKHVDEFESYEMKPADYYVSYFGDSGKNGQDDNDAFWSKLNAIFEPFQKKIDSEKITRAIDEFFQIFIPDSGNVYLLITNHVWKEMDFTYFFSEFLAHEPKLGWHKHIVHAISDLKQIENPDAKIKDWCKGLLPFAENQWKMCLMAPKPLKNSQLSIFYLQKALKEIAG
jgi:hypothetical protein